MRSSKKILLYPAMGLASVLGGLSLMCVAHPTLRSLAHKALENPQRVLDVLSDGGVADFPGRLQQKIENQEYFFSVPAMAHSNAITCVDNRYLGALQDVRKAFRSSDKDFFKKADYLAKRQIVENQLLDDLEREQSLGEISGRPNVAPSVNIHRPDYEQRLRAEVMQADFSSPTAQGQVAYWQLNQFAERLANAENLAGIGICLGSFPHPSLAGESAHMLASAPSSQRGPSPELALSSPAFRKLATILNEHGVGIAIRRKFSAQLGTLVTQTSVYSLENGKAPEFAVYDASASNPLAAWDVLRKRQDELLNQEASKLADLALSQR